MSYLRAALALALLALAGCINPGTHVDVQHDPTTGEISSFKFDRSWLGGPVVIEADVSPDGTTHFRWESDVDLDPAVRAEEIRAARQDAALARLESVAAVYAPLRTSGGSADDNAATIAALRRRIADLEEAVTAPATGGSP